MTKSRLFLKLYKSKTSTVTPTTQATLEYQNKHGKVPLITFLKIDQGVTDILKRDLLVICKLPEKLSFKDVWLLTRSEFSDDLSTKLLKNIRRNLFIHLIPY